MRAIEHIRQLIEKDVFDYTQLIHVLAEYRKPRDVVSALLRKEQIIRVRKGLYVFGELWRRQPISREMLANLVYGPSILSINYALAWYGLIPERAYVLTSITSGRSRNFNTPLGRFSYTHLSLKRFGFGATIQKSNTGNWLITEPIKALADKVWTDKRFQPTSQASFADYLFEDLRIDEATLARFYNKFNMNNLVRAYSTRKVTWMVEFLQKRY
ncbi:MAG: hypothetical protein J7K53_04770 [Bacteroidales bacterium]|nr:hypothetical protein [Bacteroidales bacterium]